MLYSGIRPLVNTGGTLIVSEKLNDVPHYIDARDKEEGDSENKHEEYNEWSREFKKQPRALDHHKIAGFDPSSWIISPVGQN